MTGHGADRCICSDFVKPHALVGFHNCVILRIRPATPRKVVPGYRRNKNRNVGCDPALEKHAFKNNKESFYDPQDRASRHRWPSRSERCVGADPPPGNVNPGSTKSGAEQTGAPNQPRSQNGGAMNATGAAPRMDGTANRDGTNATVKPGSQESGSEPAGEPAPQRR